MKRRLSVLALLMMLAVVGMIGSASAAFANDAPFLCPVVGDGVLNAFDHGGVSFKIEPPVGTSLLPGNNQAGDNANSSAYNTQGPVVGAGPGQNSDFSPIWPH